MAEERIYDEVAGGFFTEREALAADARCPDRELLVECYSRMKGVFDAFASRFGGVSEPRNPHDMTNDEMLTEMRDGLVAVEKTILPALDSPMVKQMLKMVARNGSSAG